MCRKKAATGTWPISRQRKRSAPGTTVEEKDVLSAHGVKSLAYGSITRAALREIKFAAWARNNGPITSVPLSVSLDASTVVEISIGQDVDVIALCHEEYKPGVFAWKLWGNIDPTAFTPFLYRTVIEVCQK